MALTLSSVSTSAQPAPPGATFQDPETNAFRTSLQRFIDGLDADQLETAGYAFDDDERFDFRLAPLGLEGLRVSEMSESQWATLHKALGTVLSQEGLAKTDTIRSLEREVAEVEGGLFGLLFDRIRDPRRYFLSVYGDLSAARPPKPWGMRFDGHHLSLNWTAVAGAPLSATPLFLGAQPREVPAHLERAGLRVLAAEEDLAIEFISMLGNAPRADAQIPFVRGSQIRRPGFVGDAPQLNLAPPAGVAFRKLNDAQRAVLERLIEQHLRNFIAPIARRYRRRIEAEFGSLHFAYGVPDVDQTPKAGEPLYYRIQSDGFLIEFDNTASEANHVHVVIRDVQGDFGRDALARHYRTHHPERRP